MLYKAVFSALVGFSSLAAGAAAAYADANYPIVAHTGDPVGKEVQHEGLTLYVSKPRRNKSKIGVLYLTDVFGIQLPQNKLLADSFARAGFVTVAPDMFDGSPAPEDINIPGFNTTEFLAQHGTNVTDPIIASAVSYLRNELGVGKVAVTGYCFGGRYTFRLLAEDKGADVGFAAHPSLLTDEEILAITGPASVAAAETDNLMSPARRAEVEALLGQTGQPYSLALYGGTSHGFGVRANVSDPQQKFGKEEAFFQAVRFFKAWA
ncbi:dienelactone hydrolase [Dactylonectria estremocensis]|uniref:Dienelactone hydrolase n=1 Tax=Dactylonectria estremocensis TaxID=1079267 RepID=A0A9P9FB96_9HYPO|nr:dienelactone hydrolase [Dactylonectria estremocensis]